MLHRGFDTFFHAWKAGSPWWGAVVWSFIFHIGNIWGKNVYSISIFIKYLPSFFISLSILSFYETVTASCFWQWRGYSVKKGSRQKVFYKKPRTLLNKLLNRIKIEKWWGYSVKKSRTLLKKVLNIINIEKCKRTSTSFLDSKKNCIFQIHFK